MANILVEPSTMNDQVLNNFEQLVVSSEGAADTIDMPTAIVETLNLDRLMDTIQSLVGDPVVVFNQLRGQKQPQDDSSQVYLRPLSEDYTSTPSQLLSETTASHPLPHQHRKKTVHPIVQAQFKNTFTYFASLTTTVIYLLVSPTLQFFLYDQFNTFAVMNIVWFSIQFLIGIYEIILIVGSEQMQKIFLYAVHYMQGMTLALILLNAGLLIQTIYYWCEEVEFDNHRNKAGENAHDLASWEVLQTVPTIWYLALCYLFFTDMKQHYVLQDGAVQVLIFSAYAAEVENFIMEVLIWIDGALATLYGWTYAALFIYLNPVAWLEWTFQRVTEVVKWLRTVLPSN